MNDVTTYSPYMRIHIRNGYLFATCSGLETIGICKLTDDFSITRFKANWKKETIWWSSLKHKSQDEIDWWCKKCYAANIPNVDDAIAFEGSLEQAFEKYGGQ